MKTKPTASKQIDAKWKKMAPSAILILTEQMNEQTLDFQQLLLLMTL